MRFKNILIDKTETNCEDGTSCSDDAIDEAQFPLEVVSEDGEGWSVHQWGSGPEHEAVGQVEDGQVVVEDCRQAHSCSGQGCSYQGGQPQSNLVTENSDQEWQEECCSDGKRSN